MRRWCSRNSPVMTAHIVWLPRSSGPVLQLPSRWKPVTGSAPHGSSSPPSTLPSLTPAVSAHRPPYCHLEAARSGSPPTRRSSCGTTRPRVSVCRNGIHQDQYAARPETLQVCRGPIQARAALLGVSAEDLDTAFRGPAPLDTRIRSDQRYAEGLSESHILCVVSGQVGIEDLDT